MKSLISKKNVVLALLASAFFTSTAYAVEPWATIQASVDFTQVIATVGVIAGALFGVYIIIKGIRILMGLLR